MKILVIGAGAVGGYFGAYLDNAGRDVTFLVRPAKAAQLRRNGLQIVTPDGKLMVHPQLVLKEELTSTFDLVLLGVKAFALAAAIDDLAPAVGADTMVLPLLNGMGHIKTLTARFGERAVLGGATHVSTQVDSAGRIRRLTSLHDFVYGERDGTITSRIKAVEAAVSGTGFDDRLSPDIVAYMWEKWVVLSALASITCLFRNTVGAVSSVPRGLDVAEAILDETAAIAHAEGHPGSTEFLRMARQRLTAKDSDLTASMFRDIQRGAPVEVEHVIGDLLARGESHGLQTPLLRAAYVHLAVYQAQVEKSA